MAIATGWLSLPSRLLAKPPDKPAGAEHFQRSRASQ